METTTFKQHQLVVCGLMTQIDILNQRSADHRASLEAARKEIITLTGALAGFDAAIAGWKGAQASELRLAKALKQCERDATTELCVDNEPDPETVTGWVVRAMRHQLDTMTADRNALAGKVIALQSKVNRGRVVRAKR